jgi:hypothetical protein
MVDREAGKEVALGTIPGAVLPRIPRFRSFWFDQALVFSFLGT